MGQGKIDLFNWYIIENFLCGDIVINPLRHDEFIKEKLNNTQYSIISKRDQQFLEHHPSLSKRTCTFIQCRIDSKTFAEKYNLINMDGYFYLNEQRREKQLLLKNLHQEQ